MSRRVEGGRACRASCSPELMSGSCRRRQGQVGDPRKYLGPQRRSCPIPQPCVCPHQRCHHHIPSLGVSLPRGQDRIPGATPHPAQRPPHLPPPLLLLYPSQPPWISRGWFQCGHLHHPHLLPTGQSRWVHNCGGHHSRVLWGDLLQSLPWLQDPVPCQALQGSGGNALVQNYAIHTCVFILEGQC